MPAWRIKAAECGSAGQGAGLALSARAKMRVAGPLFHMVNIARDILVIVMVPDSVEVHLRPAARAGDAIAMGKAADALVERHAAFGAAHTGFQVIDGVMHRFAPRLDRAIE